MAQLLACVAVLCFVLAAATVAVSQFGIVSTATMPNAAAGRAPGAARTSPNGASAADAAPTAGAPAPPKFHWMALGAHKLPETWGCGPIHWTLVDADAPTGANDLATRAFANITAAGGPLFTEDPPLPKLPAQFDDTRYLGIVVAWVPKSRFSLETADSDAIGVGGPGVGASGHYEHGTAWLLADWPDNQQLDFGSADAGHVLLHELGHALGLDHVLNDPNAVMAPAAGESNNGTRWSASERDALRYVRDACGVDP